MSDYILTKQCPVCGSTIKNELLNLNTGKIDNSPLYTHINIKECVCCNHIFNELTYNEYLGLLAYYKNEYSLTNLSAPDKESDRPGSSNQNSINRFKYLYNLSKKYLAKNSTILDIGCAMGGFLEYLQTKGLNNLFGIDFTDNYVNYLNKKQIFNIKLGSAENIPHEDKKFDILFMDQVLEHLVEPKRAFQEAKRVLKDGGYFCIGVPNAKGYSDNYIFDFFWFLMKEHIQHFDIDHLKILAYKEGFELVDYSLNKAPMMGENTELPNLNAIFKSIDVKNNNKNITLKSTTLSKNIKKYIATEFKRLELKRSLISNLKLTKRNIFIWGIGREYLYLLNNSKLSACNIVALVDGNSYKRDYLTINNNKINNPSLLRKATLNDILLITASAYSSKLKEFALKEYKFTGDIIEI